MRIKLKAWAARHFDPPPHIDTLRLWARTGKIYPPPVKAGRSYYVDENAEYAEDGLIPRPRLVHRIDK